MFWAEQRKLPFSAWLALVIVRRLLVPRLPSYCCTTRIRGWCRSINRPLKLHEMTAGGRDWTRQLREMFRRSLAVRNMEVGEREGRQANSPSLT